MWLAPQMWFRHPHDLLQADYAISAAARDFFFFESLKQVWYLCCSAPFLHCIPPPPLSPARLPLSGAGAQQSHCPLPSQVSHVAAPTAGVPALASETWRRGLPGGVVAGVWHATAPLWICPWTSDNKRHGSFRVQHKGRTGLQRIYKLLEKYRNSQIIIYYLVYSFHSAFCGWVWSYLD